MPAGRPLQLGGGAGAVAPNAMLNPSVSLSGLDGVDTTLRFCTMRPPSLATRFGWNPQGAPSELSAVDDVTPRLLFCCL